MYLYLFNMLENRNVILEIAISHMVKYTILIGRNYLFDYIAKSNYCTIEIFNHSFLKNNIEKRTVASLINLKKKLREFHKACKYVHQILITWYFYRYHTEIIYNISKGW